MCKSVCVCVLVYVFFLFIFLFFFLISHILLHCDSNKTQYSHLCTRWKLMFDPKLNMPETQLFSGVMQRVQIAENRIHILDSTQII